MPDYYTLSLTVLFNFSLLPTILYIGFSYSMGKQFESIMFTTGQSVGKITLAGESTYNMCNIQCGPNLIIWRYWPNVLSTGSVHFLKINYIDEINWDRTSLIRTVFPLIICLLSLQKCPYILFICSIDSLCIYWSQHHRFVSRIVT